MAQSLTYEIITNELESYEKKVATFSKLISSDISKMKSNKNYIPELTEQETEKVINMVYKVMGDVEPELAQKLFELWEIVKSRA